MNSIEKKGFSMSSFPFATNCTLEKVALISLSVKIISIVLSSHFPLLCKNIFWIGFSLPFFSTSSFILFSWENRNTRAAVVALIHRRHLFFNIPESREVVEVRSLASLDNPKSVSFVDFFLLLHISQRSIFRFHDRKI